MNQKVKIPIRLNPSSVSHKEPPIVEAAPSPVFERHPTRATKVSAPPVPPDDQRAEKRETTEETQEAWRERAMRLQAEMENFRKRQRRQAEQLIQADRERLLRSFLSVADDLERALQTDSSGAEGLRQGIDLTQRNLRRFLDREGVEPIHAQGQPFDPNWHEAVSTVSHQSAGVDPDTVAKVVQQGYRLGDQLLRPARVVVAQ